MRQDQSYTVRHSNVGIADYSGNRRKKIHEEDLQFHLELLDKLGGFESEEEEEGEEFSVEIINQIEPTGAHHAVGLTGAIDGTMTPGKPKKEEIQEARDKARAWHLDRKREKERKKK